MKHLHHRLQRAKTFFGNLFRHFIDDGCPESASALAYTSLLALVPLMAVGFTLFAAFPAFEGFTDQIRGFIFENFVPASGEIVESYLQGFVTKASALTLPGLVGLLITALLAMSTIERTFNAIWKVRNQRRPIDTFTVYWAVLTLGPILIGISLAVTSYVASLAFFSGAAGVFLKSLPFLASALAFTLLYAVVPQQKIPPRHALAGGLVGAVLFELAKKGFALFVTSFHTYETIYGALATLAIFLVWIYLSWLIILFGAEFTYCLGNPGPDAPEPDAEPPPGDER